MYRLGRPSPAGVHRQRRLSAPRSRRLGPCMGSLAPKGASRPARAAHARGVRVYRAPALMEPLVHAHAANVGDRQAAQTPPSLIPSVGRVIPLLQQGYHALALRSDQDLSRPALRKPAPRPGRGHRALGLDLATAAIAHTGKQLARWHYDHQCDLLPVGTTTGGPVVACTCQGRQVHDLFPLQMSGRAGGPHSAIQSGLRG